MHNESRMRLLPGLWLVVVAVTVTCSVAVGAPLPISALLLLAGVAPPGVMMLHRPVRVADTR
ncbi:MAG: hypothetical protein H0T71_01250 [Acidobacteria bacterium]|nr:hypothetical protein [Acidobacteriota bacterium]